MLKYVTLNQNKDFLRLYYRGKSFAKPAIVVYAMKNRHGVCRVGMTASKKIGNAVERNRSRRIIRAAYQSVFKDETFNGSWDLVFVARTRTKYQKSTAVKAEMTECLKKLGVIA
ncbi:MAG: ribonuclease P protein component [Acutalibacteraceae bacterium]